MSPKTRPVITAEGHSPSDPRKAVKKKPRKKNSSAIGATTQTSTATATSAAVDLSTPSCCGRSSSSLTPTACMKTDHTAENTKNPSQATSNQPTAGQNRVVRRPNCHAFGLRVKKANSTAHSTRPQSWTKVAAMLTAGVGFVLPVTATPISSAKVATAKVPSSASAGSHHGQRGGRAAGGTTPSGSSGVCESEAIGARRVRAAPRSATITGTTEPAPVDRIGVPVLVDNLTHPLLIDQDHVPRLNWPRALTGAAPRRAARTIPDDGVPDALIA